MSVFLDAVNSALPSDSCYYLLRRAAPDKETNKNSVKEIEQAQILKQNSVSDEIRFAP